MCNSQIYINKFLFYNTAQDDLILNKFQSQFYPTQSILRRRLYKAFTVHIVFRFRCTIYIVFFAIDNLIGINITRNDRWVTVAQRTSVVHITIEQFRFVCENMMTSTGDDLKFEKENIFSSSNEMLVRVIFYSKKYVETYEEKNFVFEAQILNSQKQEK